MRRPPKGVGKKGKGGKGREDDFELVLEFTADGAFDIRSAARNFAKIMRDTLQPIILHLPHVSVEFEPGCTPKEIVDGYHLAMKHKMLVRHSNANDTGPHKGA